MEQPQRGEIVLGTMMFGTLTPEPISYELLDRFVELGGLWLDTADCYSIWVDGRHGTSERLLGRWMQDNPQAPVKVSTKLNFAPGPTGEWPSNRMGLSAVAVRTGFEASLERLQRDRVELLWSHADDRSVDLQETVQALGDLVAQGSVARLGASNHAAWRVERARTLAQQSGVEPYTAIQLRSSIIEPRPGVKVDGSHVLLTEESTDLAAVEGMDVWAYTPLLSGALTRPDKRLHDGYDHLGTTRVLQVVAQIAQELDATVNQVTLAWLMQQPVPRSPIVGVSTLEQLEEVMGSRDITLGPEHLARIEAAR